MRAERDRLGCDPLNLIVTTSAQRPTDLVVTPSTGFLTPIVYPEPRVMETDEMTPALQFVRDETRERLREEREQAERISRLPPPRRPPEEQPFPIVYPKVIY